MRGTQKSLTYTAAVHLPCSLSGLASRVVSALARTSPDITSLPVVVLSYGHRRCHVHLTSAVLYTVKPCSLRRVKATYVLNHAQGRFPNHFLKRYSIYDCAHPAQI